MANGLARLLQRVLPVDHRAQLSGVDELREEQQIRMAHLCQKGGEALSGEASQQDRPG